MGRVNNRCSKMSYKGFTIETISWTTSYTIHVSKGKTLYTRIESPLSPDDVPFKDIQDAMNFIDNIDNENYEKSMVI